MPNTQLLASADPAQPRNHHLESLRGLAIILLVAHHVIGTDAGLGLRIEDGFYRLANDLSDHLRMPLFSILSGCTYALRPFSGDSRRFVQGKFRRLLLPMLIVGTLFAVLQANTPGTNASTTNWWLLHILPVSFFWFVEALFWVFLVVMLLEKRQVLASLQGALSTLAVAVVLYLSPLDIPYFSISGALYLFPFFLIGMIVTRYPPIPVTSTLCAGLVLSCLLLYTLVSSGFLVIEQKRSLASFSIAFSGCLALLWLVPSNRLFAFLGGFSYSIYLYHVFFSAATRIAAEKAGLENTHLIFALALSTGLLVPIALHKLFSQNPHTRVFLLGLSKQKMLTSSPKKNEQLAIS